MSWATHHIQRLNAGETVQFRPKGGSMKGLIESGQLVTVSPVASHDVVTGDIVLCKIQGRQYLHIVRAVGQDGRFLIGNNRGHINGWCSPGAIYGRVDKVEE